MSILDDSWNKELDSSILNQLQNQVDQMRDKVKQQNNELNCKNDEIENVSASIIVVILP